MTDALVDVLADAGIDVIHANDKQRFVDVPRLTDDVRDAIQDAGFRVDGKALRNDRDGDPYHRVFVRERAAGGRHG